MMLHSKILTHMECSNELSAHLAGQHTDVALLSHSKFPLGCSYLFEVPQECKLECDIIHTHNTISRLSNGFLIQSENYQYMTESRIL